MNGSENDILPVKENYRAEMQALHGYQPTESEVAT